MNRSRSDVVSASKKKRRRRRMGKRLICLAVSLMVFIFFPAHAFTLRDEGQTDRPGCDFRSFVIPGANTSDFSSVCRDARGLDPACLAWNFDPRSGTPGCFLKNCAPAPTVANGTVGGVKLPATMSGFENGFDRVGCDYRSFPVSGTQVCMATCARDSRCQAWNYDAVSGTPTCFLKSCIPAPTVVPPRNIFNIISGVKFSQ